MRLRLPNRQQVWWFVRDVTSLILAVAFTATVFYVLARAWAASAR